MHEFRKNFRLLFSRFLILLFLYSLSRFIFFLFNTKYFSESGTSQVFYAFITGLRFDISAIIITNSLFLLLHSFVVGGSVSKIRKHILRWTFYLVNIPFLTFNMMDLVYFKFNMKRATTDVFAMAGLGSDFGNVGPEFIAVYWYILLLIIAMAVLLVFLYRRTEKKEIVFATKPIYLIPSLTTTVLVAGFGLIGARGGLQLKPLGIISAAEFSAPQNAPMVLNTTFTLIKSFNKKELVPVKYFSESEVLKWCNPFQQYADTSRSEKVNVVIIILESFSREYSGFLNKNNGYTPFLDSLMRQSLCFTKGYANGKKSIEGIPGVLSGIPALMNDPFITSSYAGNRFVSIASLLRKEGYSTSFFHGGNNGTMGFDVYCRAAGFEKYVGRNQYPNPKDYDGHWGIYDEPFFQFYANNLDKMKEPFCSSIFSISSHFPYTIPPEYREIIPKGPGQIHQTIRYTDIALRSFFDTCSTKSWFDNTLFVLTADHTSDTENPETQTMVGRYEVPIIFYRHNSELKMMDSTTAQQIDILPTVLDYVGYSKPFFGFGRSLLNKNINHSAVNYMNGVYQLFSGNYAIQFDGEKTLGLYIINEDRQFKNNISSKLPELKTEMENRMKAVIQQYNHALIYNKMYAE